MNKMHVKQALTDILSGNLSILTNHIFGLEISNMAVELISNPYWNTDQIEIADCILRMSNIAYNNTSADVLPLDDGIYDQLLVIYKNYNPNYQVGSSPTSIVEIAQNENEQKIMCMGLNVDEDSKLYIKDLLGNNDTRPLPLQMVCFRRGPITKRLINTEHKYPELVGTLDKCKFVLNQDAIEAGVFDKPSVQVLERDFFGKLITNGIINPNTQLNMVCELKYDGISVEAEVLNGVIVKALSRGDTGDNIATDLTPIFGGYKFPYYPDGVEGDAFGVKFEAVITKYNMDIVGKLRNKTYKNARNAIIGLTSASDAYKYVHYITLIPLATSLDLDREIELAFINKCFASKYYNKHVFISGNYIQCLFQIKQFLESADIVRPVLPYMIDGIVVSFTDRYLIETLGRENSVNKYSMAVKFNPKVVRTIFTGYTYSIGKSGDVIPMAHFKPCEFIGGIHTKQTIHSYNRFKELNLAIGEQIDIEYRNEVISYITKPDTEYNRNLGAAPEVFITNCPYCGTEIIISESGMSAKCPNINCHERQIMKMVDMVDRLGFKDIAEETIRLLDLTSFAQLMSLRSIDQVAQLGPITSEAFVRHVNDLLIMEIPDYKLMSALSFDGMAEEKWKLVFSTIYISDLVELSAEELKLKLMPISGIGPKVLQSITDGITLYKDDLIFILNNFNIIHTRDIAIAPIIALTGFRDQEFINLLKANGFDVSDKYGVTKKTAALITNSMNSESSKMKNAKKYNIPIYTMQTFIESHGIKI